MNNDIEKWKGGNSGKPLCKKKKKKFEFFSTVSQ